MKNYLQRLGRSLMLPIAALPVAALFLGAGYAIDPAGWGGESQLAAFLIAAGGALIDNMAILFAVGVAVGMSEDQDGAAGLAGIVAWLTVSRLLSPETVAQLQKIDIEAVPMAFSKVNNAFIGITCGLVAAECYNRYHKTKLPDALAFFSGRRLVPIMTSLVMLLISALLFFIWPVIFNVLVSFGTAISSLGALGAGIYAFFNRLLIPTGLHHALNAVFWFDLIGINDIGNFWANAGTKGVTGMYQAGFFPVFMFGLPAAAYAMYRKAAPEYKQQVFSLYMAGAIAAFVTGLTEPIEFAFMFIAPQLYLIHAILTGVSVFFSALMHWTAGFGFSAGAIDFILSLNVPIANQPLMLMVQGLVVGVLYYVIFTWAIEKFDLDVPGRKSPVGMDQVVPAEGVAAVAEASDQPLSKDAQQARVIYDALGGKDNINSIGNCATRLRLNVKDSSLVDVNKIKALGVPGVQVLDTNNVHVIVGTGVQFVADEVKELYKKA